MPPLPLDGVITVDPHLHRLNELSEAIPKGAAIALGGAPRLAELIASKHCRPLLIGPDAEALQWVALAAEHIHCDYAVCNKVRHGDKRVDIALPEIEVQG